MDSTDNLGLCQGEQVVIALKIARPVPEAFTPVVFFLKPISLNHRAHGTIQEHDALFKQ